MWLTGTLTLFFSSCLQKRVESTVRKREWSRQSHLLQRSPSTPFFLSRRRHTASLSCHGLSFSQRAQDLDQRHEEMVRIIVRDDFSPWVMMKRDRWVLETRSSNKLQVSTRLRTWETILALLGLLSSLGRCDERFSLKNRSLPTTSGWTMGDYLRFKKQAYAVTKNIMSVHMPIGPRRHSSQRTDLCEFALSLSSRPFLSDAVKKFTTNDSGNRNSDQLRRYEHRYKKERKTKR